jgi:hypothetical protein
MNRPNKATAVAVAGAVAAVAALTGAVALAQTATPGRHPRPGGPVQIIEQPPADRFFDAAPYDGQLVQQRCAPAGCDPNALAEYLQGGFVSVIRLYRTPAPYSLEQLRQRFDQPAAAGGWQLDLTDYYTQPPRYALATVIYCRKTSHDVWYANVNSSNALTDDSDPKAPPVVGVQVAISSRPRNGDICGIANRPNHPDTAEDRPAGPSNGTEAR